MSHESRPNARVPMSSNPLVAVTTGAANALLGPYLDALERAGAVPWALGPDMGLTTDEVLAQAGALVLTDGEDVRPPNPMEDSGGESLYNDARDEMELGLARAALDDDLPIYGIGRGMAVLNLAAGGGLIGRLDGHPPSPSSNSSDEARYHHIYISPGSKLAAVVGSGGFVRVNSLHRQGVREAQKSPRLLASAYSLDDGVIEALESPAHRWVIAVQFNPERRMEVPPHFDRLFQSLVERAAERISLKMSINSFGSV